MSLSRCANAPSLVSLAQKFTNSEDPMFKKVFPFGQGWRFIYFWGRTCNPNFRKCNPNARECNPNLGEDHLLN